MKVIAIFDFVISPYCKASGMIKIGKIYSVKSEISSYSHFAKRIVHAYELHGMESLWDKSIFIPLSEIDEKEINKKTEINVL